MSSTDNSFDSIIIGGGHNGLVCAWYLARKGMHVCVLEKNAQVGGAAITEEFFPGFRNSVASYTVSLLQPKVIAEMQLQRHGLDVVLRKIDNFLPDEGDYLLAGGGGLTEQEIARHSPADVQAYVRYQASLEKVVDCLQQFVLLKPPNAGGGLADVVGLLKSANTIRKLSLSTQTDLLNFFTKSAAEILDQYFENELVKALFAFDATVGHFTSPYEPGSAYVLLHHLFGEAAGQSGAWGHAIGGMGAITQAMQSACIEAGVEIKTEQSVEAINCSAGKVVGVRTAEGQLKADCIASSVHPQILFEQLVDPQYLPADFLSRINQYQSHSGTFRMNVALDKLPKFTQAPSNETQASEYLTSGIIIAPSQQYMHDAWRSATQHGWSKAPIIEMLIPSTLDDSLAPKDKHIASLFCQHFSYDLPDGQTWEQQRELAADHIIQTVEQHAPGFANSILGRQVLSPYDLEQKFGLVRGDIFHGRMSLDQLFSARPVLGYGDYRTPIKGLYMCGSGTHPGGGVTGAPGHNAAREIINDKSKWF